MTILQYENKNITNLTHLANNTEWYIYNTCALNKTIETSAGLKWWLTRYVVQIKRASIYHFYTLLMPCCVLSLCSVLLFWLPPDSEEKIALGVTILLAFFVNSLVVSNYTPEASFDLPVIGKYYAFNIFIVASSLAGTVFILKLHFRGHKTNRVPKWIRILFKIEELKELKSKKFDLLKINHLNNLKSIENNFTASFKVVNNNEQDEKQENHRKSKKTTHKLLELIKNDMKRTRLKQLKKEALDLILIEWKELGRKVESIFFLINILAVFILPSVLFYKYLIQDLSVDFSLHKNCACDLISQ